MGNDAFHIASPQTPEQAAQTRARQEQLKAELGEQTPRHVAVAHIATAVANDDRADGIAQIGGKAVFRASDRIKSINDCPVRGC